MPTVDRPVLFGIVLHHVEIFHHVEILHHVEYYLLLYNTSRTRRRLL